MSRIVHFKLKFWLKRGEREFNFQRWPSHRDFKRPSHVEIRVVLLLIWCDLIFQQFPINSAIEPFRLVEDNHLLSLCKQIDPRTLQSITHFIDNERRLPGNGIYYLSTPPTQIKSSMDVSSYPKFYVNSGGGKRPEVWVASPENELLIQRVSSQSSYVLLISLKLYLRRLRGMINW